MGYQSQSIALMGRILTCEINLIGYCLGDVIADKCIMITTLGSRNHSSRIHRWHGEDIIKSRGRIDS